jgi:hypothetical protein
MNTKFITLAVIVHRTSMGYPISSVLLTLEYVQAYIYVRIYIYIYLYLFKLHHCLLHLQSR